MTAPHHPGPAANHTPQPAANDTPRPAANHTPQPAANHTAQPAANDTPRPAANHTPQPAANDTAQPRHPDIAPTQKSDQLLPDQLLQVVLAFLAPLLSIGSADDARLAARQAIAACTAAGHNNLVSIAQIVGLAIASLDNLRLSASSDLSLPMKLKLRANANALSRTSLNAKATPAKAIPAKAAPDSHPPPAPTAAQTPTDPPSPAFEPDPDEAQRQARVIAALRDTHDQVRKAQAAEPALQPAEPLTQRQCDLSWASAMTEVANECRAAVAHLPPEQRRIEMTRINALTKTAHDLTHGNVPLRARLLGATALQSPSLRGPSLQSPSPHGPSPHGPSPHGPSPHRIPIPPRRGLRTASSAKDQAAAPAAGANNRCPG